MSNLFLAIASWWKSLFARPARQPQKPEQPDVDEVARAFYDNLLESEENESHRRAQGSRYYRR